MGKRSNNKQRNRAHNPYITVFSLKTLAALRKLTAKLCCTHHSDEQPVSAIRVIFIFTGMDDDKRSKFSFDKEMLSSSTHHASCPPVPIHVTSREGDT